MMIKFGTKLLHKNTSLLLSRAANMSQTPVDIAGMRKPYKGENDAFVEKDLEFLEPFGQFRAWFDVACKTEGILEANAMALATATKEGKPSVRTVLLKGYDKNGFKFYTNFDSRKGRELASNPFASLVFYWTNAASGEDTTWSRQKENPFASIQFYWEPLLKVVRIEGKVEKLSEQESTEYFHSRPRASQIGACVSHQSQPIKDRTVLTDRRSKLQEMHADESKAIPKPNYWGGYIVIPEAIEFWQGQTDRIHDRILFRRKGSDEKIDNEITKEGQDGWVYERLSP